MNCILIVVVLWIYLLFEMKHMKVENEILFEEKYYASYYVNIFVKMTILG
jgi:hypothetical protein